MKAFLLKVIGGVALFYILPLVSLAQTYEAGKDDIQGYILLILQFINWTILPLLFSIALLFFLINAARYFILQGDKEDGREKAKLLALYGIGAFVFLVSIWGIVNMFIFGLGIGGETAKCPDYLGDWCKSSSAVFRLQDERRGFDYYGSGSDDYFYIGD
jgi:succinate dehydrogenase/fumarate reductase cytochrome b subunit